MPNSKLSSDYQHNLSEFREFFPEAAAFLDRLAHDDGDLWLSTDQNAHLYSAERFLGYLRFQKEGVRSALMFSPKYHAKIAGGTHDASGLIFVHPIRDLLSKHDWKNWAKMAKDGDAHAFVFYPGAPRDSATKFFDELVALIKERVSEDDGL